MRLVECHHIDWAFGMCELFCPRVPPHAAGSLCADGHWGLAWTIKQGADHP
ncbi:hypothetical protein PgNI_11164 [Pyricularia grisea]|uniref:Uncharacterized protein n=1 Tax=Pyricularia grisea TaxID=148305 RepID=A0A6P8APZ0_PYRGI|nr:hypothetical protein PgNI_11164 [Pyricularia grisea]TLD04088.1 hypothetical protein PgNI_11164 [Pyricularia grisea]